MSAWFALTQGRYRDVLDAVTAGRAATPNHSLVVQLWAQEAKARGRLADLSGVHHALDAGAKELDHFPRPTRPEHHFVVDPDK